MPTATRPTLVPLWITLAMLPLACSDPADPGADDTSEADDTTAPGDDSAGDDDTTAGDDDTSPPDDDTSAADDDTSVEDDDTSAGDDDTSAADDDTSAADDDTSAADDDTSAADDDATPSDDDGTASDDDSTPLPDDDTTGGPPTYDECFADITGDPDAIAPDYDVFDPVIGSHCNGTDHQEVLGVERVVFLGDSVAVGTPPSWPEEFYRSLLADQLAIDFGLEAPSLLWKAYDPFNGTSLVQDSGDFSSCARWGARTDDLMADGSMVLDCLPEDQREKVTLVVISMGGNDLSALTQGFLEGRSNDDLWIETWNFMALMREAVEWIVEPGRFPNGVYVTFTNLYEFTDGTGDVTACPLAELAGFGDAVTDPALAEMVVWAMEEFMHIATDTRTDMLFLLEAFCGHGFNYDDPDGRCYRGPDAELWFDLTCIHPNPAGHSVIADMFHDVVVE